MVFHKFRFELIIIYNYYLLYIIIYNLYYLMTYPIV